MAANFGRVQRTRNPDGTNPDWDPKLGPDPSAPKPFTGLMGPNYTATPGGTESKDPDIQTNYNIALSQENPLQWQRYYDSSVDNDIVNPQMTRALTGYYDQALGYGVGEAAKPVSAGAVSGGDAGDPMTQALASKYSQQVGNKLNDIRTKNQIDAPVKESDEMARTGNILGAEEVNKIQNFKEQYAYQQKRQEIYNQWKAQQDAAKAQVFSSIMGMASSIGGAVASKA